MQRLSLTALFGLLRENPICDGQAVRDRGMKGYCLRRLCSSRLYLNSNPMLQPYSNMLHPYSDMMLLLISNMLHPNSNTLHRNSNMMPHSNSDMLHTISNILHPNYIL